MTTPGTPVSTRHWWLVLVVVAGGCGAPSAERAAEPGRASAVEVGAGDAAAAEPDVGDAAEAEFGAEPSDAEPWVAELTGYPDEVMREVEALHELLDRAWEEQRTATTAEARLAVGRRLSAMLGPDTALFLESESGVDALSASVRDTLQRIGPAAAVFNRVADDQITLMRALAADAGPALPAFFRWFADHATDPSVLRHARELADSPSANAPAAP